MITIMKIEQEDEMNIEYIQCPICKARLCDKRKGVKTCTNRFTKNKFYKDEPILLKCVKCGSKYCVYTQA